MRILGTRLLEAREAVRQWKGGGDAFYSEEELNRNPSGGTPHGRSRAPRKLFMQVVVSLAILGAGLFMILHGSYSADAQKWAAGLIGSVVGYWLS